MNIKLLAAGATVLVFAAIFAVSALVTYSPAIFGTIAIVLAMMIGVWLMYSIIHDMIEYYAFKKGKL